MARLRAHLMDEVRNRAGRAARDWLKRLSDLTGFPEQARSISRYHSASTQSRLQGAYALRKDAKPPSQAGSARAIPGPLCFATGICSLRFTSGSRISY
ncbi:hypothetical protein F3I52_03470 [Pantoea sp. M_8]|nr:hypothetical protein F3I51_07920 [Pantoea sp. M_6]KAA5980966.1 hypothetical protein F3I52_03470 [Pantoea sp. M_8]